MTLSSPGFPGALALVSSILFINIQTSDPLPIGASVPFPDHRVPVAGGGETSFSDSSLGNGLLVVFICNTCPWVRKWEDRFNVITAAASELAIGVIFLNSNEALRESSESLEAMHERSLEAGYQFAYAADIDNILADAFGAIRTPDTYLFDSTMVLRYRGAIDDNARDALQATPYLTDAMRLMTDGDEITTPVQKAIGCTIKRVAD